MKRFTFETFEVREENRQAFELCRLMSGLEMPQDAPATLVGPDGTGKTHLLLASFNASRDTERRVVRAYIKAQSFPRELRALAQNPAPLDRAEAAILLVDDLDDFQEWLQELEQVVLRFVERGHAVLLAAREHPDDLMNLPQGLRDMLSSGSIAELKSPDAVQPEEEEAREEQVDELAPPEEEQAPEEQADELAPLEEDWPVASDAAALETEETPPMELDAQRAGDELAQEGIGDEQPFESGKAPDETGGFAQTPGSETQLDELSELDEGLRLGDAEEIEQSADVEAELERVRDQLKALESEGAVLREDADSLRAQLAQTGGERDSLAEEVETMRGQLAQRLAEEETVEAAGEASAESEEAAQERESLESERGAIESARAEIENEKQGIEQQRADLDAERESVESARQAVEEERRRLEDDRAALTSEIEQLEHSRASAMDALKDSDSAREEAQDVLRHARDFVAATDSVLNEFRSRLDNQAARQEQLQEALEEARSTSVSAETSSEESGELQARVEELQQNLQEREAALAEREKALQEQRAELEELRGLAAENEASGERLNQLQSELDDARKELESRQSEADKLNDRVRQAEGVSEERERLSGRVEELEEQVSELQAELAKARSDNNKMQEELGGLRREAAAQVAEVQAQAGEVEARLHQTQAKLDLREGRVKEFAQRASAVEEQAADSLNRLRELIADLTAETAGDAEAAAAPALEGAEPARLTHKAEEASGEAASSEQAETARVMEAANAGPEIITLPPSPHAFDEPSDES